VPLTEPRDGALADLLAGARGWMEREAAFRANKHLKLRLREMEHFEEVAYLQSHQASGPVWRRLIVLKLGFRLERLSKLRKQASAS
jgi:hypothetical protein